MLGFFKKRKDRKVVVLGLDGVPYSLLREYLGRGIMPRLQGLCETGGLFKMKSTLPEISSVAWTSFMTGKNPAEHGIFGFMELDRQTYAYTFPNFSSLKVKPYWETKSIKTVVINIPQTYPANPMNGVMVSGFIALDLKKATYPDRVYEYLNGMGYRLDVNAKLALDNPEAFFKDLFETMEKRKAAIAHLYDHEDWELFIGAVTETDRLHHFFFDSALEGQYYPVFERFYRDLDEFIGLLADKALKDGAVFFTCSDHGFTPIKREVYLNRWLVENGYLRLDGSEGLKGMAPDSRVFCLDPSRVYLHTEGKYRKGSVKSSEIAELIDALKEAYMQMNFEGEKIIKRVYLRDEIFKGNCLDQGPELYLLPHYGFDLKGSVNKEHVFGRSHFRGMHTYDDAHFYSSTREAVADEMENVPGIILEHLGH